MLAGLQDAAGGRGRGGSGWMIHGQVHTHGDLGEMSEMLNSHLRDHTLVSHKSPCVGMSEDLPQASLSGQRRGDHG